MNIRNRLFIGGEWTTAAENGDIAVLNPHDNSVITEVSEARENDVDRAVDAANTAFPVWSRMSPMDRGRLLLKLADAIEAHAEELAQLESTDTGHPLKDTRLLDVPRTAATFRYFGGMADKFEGSVVPVETGFLNYVEHEPVGVVGQIIPWNFPLMFTSWKMGPALAAGNTIVLKPSELTPLSSLRIAELMQEVGIPNGVVNVIPGFGNTAGQRIAEHPDIQKVAFTGSTATGRKIVTASSGNLKKVQLELGGKGANIIFADANVDAAVNGSAFAIFHNQGQACIAGSRLLIHESILNEFIDKLILLTRSIRVGNPLSKETEMGPLTSRMHQARVLEYCKITEEEGGEILIGGNIPEDPGLANGCYISPTIVRANPTDRVCLEEVFGPFVSVTSFREEEEVIAMANNTEYGLGGGLWTNSLQRAHRVAKHMVTGMVWINCYKRVHPGSPFGGVRSSGYGREMGFEAMREYTTVKSVWVNVNASIPAYYPREN